MPLRRTLAAILLALFALGLTGSPAGPAHPTEHAPAGASGHTDSPGHEPGVPSSPDERQRCPGICFCIAQCGAADLGSKPRRLAGPYRYGVGIEAIVAQPVGRLAALLPYSTGPPILI